MADKRITEIFEDKELIKKIKGKLPYLFQIAELESSRDGKIGMEVGSLREKIIIALLIYKFGEENVKTDIPITKHAVDVEVFGFPLSIKTLSSKTLTGFKLIWTVDTEKANEFMNRYIPECDILFVRINWGGIGEFYYFPIEAQKIVLNKVGIKKYIKLPKAGTNPRGVEITKYALNELAKNRLTKSIQIVWNKRKIDYNPYERWIDYWK